MPWKLPSPPIPEMHGQVGTYLSIKLREALTGDPDSNHRARLWQQPRHHSRQGGGDRASIAKIPGIVKSRVELQIEEPGIEVKVDVDRAADYGLKPGDVRRATSAIVGGITVGALSRTRKFSTWLCGVDRSCATTSMMCGI